MKYLRRLRNEISHIRTISYLFGKCMWEDDLCISIPFRYEYFKPVSELHHYERLHYGSYNRNRIKPLIELLKGKWMRVKAFLDQLIDYGRYRVIQKCYSLGIRYPSECYNYCIESLVKGHPLCMVIMLERFHPDMNIYWLMIRAAKGHPICLQLLFEWEDYMKEMKEHWYLFPDSLLSIIFKEQRFEFDIFKAAAEGHPKCLKLLCERYPNVARERMENIINHSAAFGYPQCIETVCEWASSHYPFTLCYDDIYSKYTKCREILQKWGILEQN